MGALGVHDFAEELLSQCMSHPEQPPPEPEAALAAAAPPPEPEAALAAMAAPPLPQPDTSTDSLGHRARGDSASAHALTTSVLT